MKYVIIGSALSGNKGAAAMLESSIQMLGQLDANAEFTLFSVYPAEDARLNTYSSLSILRATPFYLGLVINPLALTYRIFPPFRNLLCRRSVHIKALVEADVLLDQGGITFSDGRGKFLIYNIATILPPLLVGTRVIKSAQALGPFRNPVNRWCARMFLPRMARIFSRGEITHKNLKALGLTNVTPVADQAFTLDITEEIESSARQKVDISFFDNPRVVGVSPSSVMRKKLDLLGKDYIELTAGFINQLIANGDKVALIPHCIRWGINNTHNNDLPTCRRIYARIREPEQCLFISQDLSALELRYIIGQCELFVASRFHAMVSSLAMGIPTLVIGWSHKYEEVLAMLQLEQWAFDYDKITVEFLCQKLSELRAVQPSVKKTLARNLPTVQAKSRKQSALIIEEINEYTC